jgi:hypothetical protein
MTWRSSAVMSAINDGRGGISFARKYFFSMPVFLAAGDINSVTDPRDGKTDLRSHTVHAPVLSSPPASDRPGLNVS